MSIDSSVASDNYVVLSYLLFSTWFIIGSMCVWAMFLPVMAKLFSLLHFSSNVEELVRYPGLAQKKQITYGGKQLIAREVWSAVYDTSRPCFSMYYLLCMRVGCFILKYLQ